MHTHTNLSRLWSFSCHDLNSCSKASPATRPPPLLQPLPPVFSLSHLAENESDIFEPASLNSHSAALRLDSGTFKAVSG